MQFGYLLSVTPHGLVDQGRVVFDELCEMRGAQGMGLLGVGRNDGSRISVHWGRQRNSSQLKWGQVGAMVFLRAQTGADTLRAVTRRTGPFLRKSKQ